MMTMEFALNGAEGVLLQGHAASNSSASFHFKINKLLINNLYSKWIADEIFRRSCVMLRLT